jgi:hypothetical protein
MTEQSPTRVQIKAKAARIAADRALLRLQAEAFEERVRARLSATENRIRTRATAPDTLAISFLAGFAVGEVVPALGRAPARASRSAAPPAEPGLLQTIVRAAAPVIATAGMRRFSD